VFCHYIFNSSLCFTLIFSHFSLDLTFFRFRIVKTSLYNPSQIHHQSTNLYQLEPNSIELFSVDSSTFYSKIRYSSDRLILSFPTTSTIIQSHHYCIQQQSITTIPKTTVKTQLSHLFCLVGSKN
jgi:hypothetical protein